MANDSVAHERPLVTRAEAKAQGLKRYFTGEPCRNGHADERIFPSGKCVRCERERMKLLKREARRTGRYAEKEAAYMKQYRSRPEVATRIAERERNRRADPAHIEWRREWARRRLKDDETRARINASRRLRYRRLREEILAAQREDRKDPQRRLKIAQRVAAYKRANPEKVSALNHARRARKRAADGFYTAADVERLLTEQSCLCVGCGSDIAETYTIDHKTPLSRGGSNWPENIQLLCGPCNSAKGALTMDEWLSTKSANDNKEPQDYALSSIECER